MPCPWLREEKEKRKEGWSPGGWQSFQLAESRASPWPPCWGSWPSQRLDVAPADAWVRRGGRREGEVKQMSHEEKVDFLSSTWHKFYHFSARSNVKTWKQELVWKKVGGATIPTYLSRRRRKIRKHFDPNLSLTMDSTVAWQSSSPVWRKSVNRCSGTLHQSQTKSEPS